MLTKQRCTGEQQLMKTVVVLLLSHPAGRCVLLACRAGSPSPGPQGNVDLFQSSGAVYRGDRGGERQSRGAAKYTAACVLLWAVGWPHTGRPA